MIFLYECFEIIFIFLFVDYVCRCVVAVLWDVVVIVLIFLLRMGERVLVVGGIVLFLFL